MRRTGWILLIAVLFAAAILFFDAVLESTAYNEPVKWTIITGWFACTASLTAVSRTN